MTTTINTQALVNYGKAADEILSLIDDLGFTTDKAFDPKDLAARIVGIIALSTRVTYGEVIDIEVEEQEPTDEDLEQMLAELKEEDEQEQQNFYNTCPHCGQLVR